MRLSFILFTITCFIYPTNLFGQTDAIGSNLVDASLISFLKTNYYPSSPKNYNTARDSMFISIDVDASDSVRGVYTGLKVKADGSRTPANGSLSLNTEHSWPQSFYDGGEPMKSDIHHLYPVWSSVNSSRGNHPFAEIADNLTSSWWYWENGGSVSSIPSQNIDSYSEYYNNSFEPREDHKGNVARAMFYFWTMYSDNSDIVNDDFDNSAFFEGMKSTLYSWHKSDPVNSAEVARSNAVYAVQGNKNPFIHDTTLVRRAFFSTPAWINEFHYDNAGSDTGEFVEIVIENPSSYTLNNFKLELYNGSNSQVYDSQTGSNFTVGSSIGNYTIYYWTPSSIQNGGPDGVALSYNGDLIQFLSYEGQITGADGTANGITSTDVGISETSSTSAGHSLYLTGTGTKYSDFSWTGPNTDSPGNTNTGQNFTWTTSITGDAGWRLLSLPITSGDVSDVSDDSPVQGIAGGSNTGSPSNFYIYDNSGAWEEPSNATTAWGDGYGFAMYFYNNTSNGSSALPVTLDASGSEPSSNVTVNLYGGAANRFTLVGNPFASNINTNSITVTGGSIQNNISFWNDGGSTYSAQDRTGPYIIAPWQGFFVETSDANATSITIPTSAKTTSGTSGTFFSKVADIQGDINFALSSETTNDEAIRLSFRANATPDWDLDDASKLTPLLPAYATLGFATNDMVKSVESLPYRLEEEVTLPMQLDLVGVEGEFSLGWDGLETIPDEWELVLHDYEQGTSVNLRDIDEYTFEAEPEVPSKRNPLTVLSMSAKSMAKASQGERFGLTVRPVSVGNEEELSPYNFTLDQNYPNPFNPSTTITYSLESPSNIQLIVYDALGREINTLYDGYKDAGKYTTILNAHNLSSGLYYLILETETNRLTRKLLLVK